MLIYEEEILGLQSLTATLAAATTGKTKISAISPTTESGNSLKYKVGSAAETVVYDTSYTTGWTALTVGTTEISVTAGQVISVIEVDGSNKAKKFGYVTVVDNIG